MKKLLKILLMMLIFGLLFPQQILAKHTYLDKDERALLNSLSPLKIMVDDGFAPISFYNNKTNQYEGIAVEVIKQLAETLDFKYTIIRDKDLTWSDKINSIKNNDINFLGGASISEERQDYGYFNDQVYFFTNYSLIGNVENHISIKDLKDFSKYRLGLVKDSVINDYLLDYSNLEQLTYFDTMEAALKALSLQDIDLVAENEAVFIEDYFKDIRFDFEILFPIYDLTKSYAFFFPKTSQSLKLIKIIDKGMENIDIDKIVSDRYQNKSIFSYYKNYIEELRVDSLQKNILLASLSLVIFAGVIFVLVMRVRNKELTAASETDYLTKLKNRKALFKDYSNKSSLDNKLIYFIDLDDFKLVNDTYGHQAGDEVLINVAKSLQVIVPTADIYRMGGDEFILITNNFDERLGQRILNKIKLPILYQNNLLQVFASVGYLKANKFKDFDLSELINLADQAMFKAKASGKNNILEVE